jgi:imidazoleglycerol-phosphate dehydratase
MRIMRKGKGDGLFRDCRAVAEVQLDGNWMAEVRSGSGFLDHMLTAFARTASIDLTAEAQPGFWKNEALGSAIGLSLDKSLGERRGIHRYGSASVPMDEALADVALDFSGRPYLVMMGEFRSERVGDYDVQNLQPFLEALTVGARLTLHVRFYGENDHHKMESIFKALGFAIREAVTIEGTAIPSTKGVI